MRPRRLELEGFTAYRGFTVVDFDGADLFVLTGPTGSGKSSLIDAMTFALYGSVSRYANPNIVYPVISQGKNEARVRFDFTVEDEQYTAVRVVRRTPSGATTKEARLESGDRVLAGTADEVTRSVRSLLGLDFEQFNTCVVLPQGDFARFLHEKPGVRQNLLTKLLGLGVYDVMRRLARNREAVAKQMLSLHEAELAKAVDVTKEARKAAAKRVAILEEIKREIELRQPEVDALGAECAAKLEEAKGLDSEVEALEALGVPPRVARLSKRLEAASEKASRAKTERSSAGKAVAKLEEEIARLPDLSALHGHAANYQALTDKKKSLAKAKEQARGSGRVRRSAEREKATARKEMEEARAALESARMHHSAHALAGHLERGKPCPVCGQKVRELPERELPFPLDKAEKDLASAEKLLHTADETLRAAEMDESATKERVSLLSEELQSVANDLAPAQPEQEVRRQIQSIEQRQKKLSEAKNRLAKAEDEEAQAVESLESLRETESSAWKGFDEARDRLSTLAPPSPDRDSLEKAWTSLLDWAKEQTPKRRNLAKDARSAARKAECSRAGILQTIAKAAEAAEVSVDEKLPRDAIVSALAEAKHELARIDDALKRAAELEHNVKEQRETVVVSGALGRHLRADGFERWLLDEAVRRLVVGATSILKELSSGQYSLECDERHNFEVVDHRNADERRLARTLSGGETFLASLALALTLAEQTAELAAQGSARLESLFLDEGFGTLDDDTLEVVATAIEELGARGRIVGLVTHQQRLADRIPVQFRVSKGPATSTVERVVP